MFGINFGFAWEKAYNAMRWILKSPKTSEEEKRNAIEDFINITNKIVIIYGKRDLVPLLFLLE